jgi:hypothetical protein
MTSVVWTPTGIYHRVDYANEADFENAILQVQHQLFGSNRIYLDVKKKIGRSSGIRNIPDGYLIDLTGRLPRLYVVENELAAHDPLRHIAVQILQFSLSFESDGRTIKKILFDALQATPMHLNQCQAYVTAHNFRNLDHFLEYLVFESQFAALVIIDEMPDSLAAILAKKFKFGAEVLELSRFQNSNGDYLYQFEPFLIDAEQDLEVSAASGSPDVDLSELDTVVVPAREDGFQKTFLGENRWHAIRMHGTMRPQIKYIAVYRIRPISAITHIARVASIEPWKDTDKFVVNFAEPAQEIEPIPLVKGGHIKAFQNLRYTTSDRLDKAQTLDDLW